MSNTHTVQYTIRNVPPAMDAVLKSQAKKRGVSLNKLLLGKIGALPKPIARKPKVYHDLDWFYGSMTVHEADQLWGDISAARQADRRRTQEEFAQAKITKEEIALEKIEKGSEAESAGRRSQTS